MKKRFKDDRIARNQEAGAEVANSALLMQATVLNGTAKEGHEEFILPALKAETLANARRRIRLYAGKSA